MDIEKKLTTWLTSELSKSRPEGKPLRRFVLRTAAPGSKGTDIETWEHEVRLEVEEIPLMSCTMLQRAQDDATGNGPNIQRYTLFAFQKGSTQPSARFIFRLRGESDLDLDDETGDDAPTNKGLLTQLMRHNEALARAQQQSVGTMMSMMARMLESSNSTNEKLLKERSDMFDSLESAKSQEHERAASLMLTDGEMQRKDKAFDKLMGLLPLVVNRIVGSKVMPGGDDPTMMMLDPLISTMTAEQFQAISANLTGEQQLIFFELLQTIQKRKAASQPKEN